MSTNNPYAFDDDADADLFASAAPNGQAPEKSALVQAAIDRLIDEVGEPMSEQEREQFTQLLNQLPVEVLRNAEILVQSVNGTFNLMDRFDEFTQFIETLNPHAPMLRAMYELLNDMTNGALARRWKIYRHEQLLCATHLALKGLNNMSERATADNAPEVILNLFSNMVQSLLDRIFSLSEEYRVLTQLERMEPDESLIANGNYTPGRFDEAMEFTINTVFDVAMQAASLPNNH